MKLHYLFNLDTNKIIAVLPENNNIHVAEHVFGRDSILDAKLYAARHQLVLNNLVDEIKSQFGVSAVISEHNNAYTVTLTDANNGATHLSKYTLEAFKPFFHSDEDRKYLENYEKNDLWKATMYFCKYNNLV